MHNLLDVSGALDTHTVRVRARPASRAELARVHSGDYISRIAALSADSSKGCHRAGPDLSFSPGGYEIAALAAGGAIALVDAVMAGSQAAGSPVAGSPSVGGVDQAAAAAAGGHGGAAEGGGAVGGGPPVGAYGLVRPPGHHAERSEGMG
jgi:acetoin utilization deacetylase AcuC-like enzyme